MHLLPSVISNIRMVFDLILTIYQIPKNMKIDKTIFAKNKLVMSAMIETLTLYGGSVTVSCVGNV